MKTVIFGKCHDFAKMPHF